jgi:uncharacterized RDD family membrane protein YckC
MNITCPLCGFTKDIDPTRIPKTTKKVVCPQCKKLFILAEATPQPPFESEQPTPQEEFPPADLPVVPPTDTPGLTAAPADRPKAGFWIRVVASLLDSLLLGGIQLFFAVVLGLTAGDLDAHSGAAVGLLTSLSGLVLGIAYAVFFTGYCGQTPGKMLLRIKVIRTSGAEIGYGRAFLREIPGKFLSGIILGIGYLMVAFDDRKQGLHDRIADTYVVKL